MEILTTSPTPSQFVPLVQHQSTTPASFYSGPAVLHYYSDRSKVIVLSREVTQVEALKNLVERDQSRTNKAHEGNEESGVENGDDEEGREEEKITLENVDVWVTSDKLLLYSPTATAGLSIPYPSISLHAIQSLPTPSSDQQGVYMQIITSTTFSNADEDTDLDSISITVIPTASAPPVTTSTTNLAEEKPEQTPVVAMFNALSNCSNLHPDPTDEVEEDSGAGSRLFRSGLAIPGDSTGGMPPALPGSGGWITAENMHEFIDENGEWIDQDNDEEVAEDQEGVNGDGAGENLGPGAGMVRSRDENGTNDHQNGGGEETKWRRTS